MLVGIAFAMLLSTTLSVATSEAAYAESIDLVTNIQQSEIEVLEAAHKSAEQKLLEAKARVAENQAKIDAIMRKLPAQQARTDAALRELYIMEDNRLMHVEMLLGADSLSDFFRRIDYFDRVSKVNLEELNKLKAMLEELEEARKELDAAQAEADQQAAIAREALTLAQDQRANRQHDGQVSGMAQDNNAAIIDGADWHMTEEQFVATWAPRIDAYLEGSPLAGTGTIFATMSFR